MKLKHLFENNPNIDYRLIIKRVIEAGKNRIKGIEVINRNYNILATNINEDPNYLDYEEKMRKYLENPVIHLNQPEPKFIPNIKLVDAANEFAKYYINIIKENETFYSILEQLNYPATTQNLGDSDTAQEINNLYAENKKIKLEFSIEELTSLFDRVSPTNTERMTKAISMGNSNKYRRDIHESIFYYV